MSRWRRCAVSKLAGSGVSLCVLENKEGMRERAKRVGGSEDRRRRGGLGAAVLLLDVENRGADGEECA